MGERIQMSERSIGSLYILETALADASDAFISACPQDRPIPLQYGHVYVQLSGSDPIEGVLLVEIPKEIETAHFEESGRIVPEKHLIKSVARVSVWMWPQSPFVFASFPRDITMTKITNILSELLGYRVERARIRKELMRRLSEGILGQTTSVTLRSSGPMSQDFRIGNKHLIDKITGHRIDNYEITELIFQMHPGLKWKLTNQSKVTFYNSPPLDEVMAITQAMDKLLRAERGEE